LSDNAARSFPLFDWPEGVGGLRKERRTARAVQQAEVPRDLLDGVLVMIDFQAADLTGFVLGDAAENTRHRFSALALRQVPGDRMGASLADAVAAGPDEAEGPRHLSDQFGGRQCFAARLLRTKL